MPWASQVQPFSRERSEYCCPGLPGFPRENIQGDMDVMEERHTELFIEQVKRRVEGRREGLRKKRGVENYKKRNRGVCKGITKSVFCSQ